MSGLKAGDLFPDDVVFSSVLLAHALGGTTLTSTLQSQVTSHILKRMVTLLHVEYLRTTTRLKSGQIRRLSCSQFLVRPESKSTDDRDRSSPVSRCLHTRMFCQASSSVYREPEGHQGQ